jgi:transposase
MTQLPTSSTDQTGRLTAEQWRDVEVLLPSPSARGRPYADRRSVIEGVIWQYLTACPWRTIPRRYAPWQTCYHYRRELDRLGLWPVMTDLLALVPGAAHHHRRPAPLPQPDQFTD